MAAFSAPLAQWVQPSRQIGTGIYTLLARDGDLYAGTDGNGAFRSTDRGAIWDSINIGFPQRQGVYAFAEFGGRFFAGTYNGVYYSSDSGKNWARSNHANWKYLHVVGLAGSGKFLFATSNSDFSLALNGGIFRSADSGLTWTPVNKGFTATIWINTLVQHSGALYVGTSGEGIFRSTDNGETWTPFNSGFPRNLDFDPRHFFSKDDRLYAGTDNGVYVLAAGSNTWTRISKGLPDGYLITSFAAYGTHLFAGSSPFNGGGVFHSADKGASWQRVSRADSEPLQVASLAVLGDELFASTGQNACSELGCGGSFGGIWKASIPSLLGTTANGPQGPGARQSIWQRTVVPGENIRFDLASRSFVTMQVHDASGKPVSSLVDRQFSPGRHSVPFETAARTKGPFFIRFRARSMAGTPEK